MDDFLAGYKLILGSHSPRRKQLLKEMGFSFVTMATDFEEIFDPAYSPKQMAEKLSLDKSHSINLAALDDQSLLITADTIVELNGCVFGKPENENEAVQMLEELSGKTHQVITGVALRSKTKQLVFHDVTLVSFRSFQHKEIRYYVDNYQPFDKAGAYGIQEWIGLNGVTEIRGSYFNVVGLPCQKLYLHLKEFAEKKAN